MAKREEQCKNNEVLDELEKSETHQELTKNTVDFTSPSVKKKKVRKKMKTKSKTATGPSRSLFARSYIFDSKRDKDKNSEKVNIKNF